MSKCYVEELKQVYAHLFSDIVYTYPTLRDECDKDLARLSRLSDQRGLNYLAVDLPAIGKHFDKCLSVGQYVPSGLPTDRQNGGGVRIPLFLRGLYSLVFDAKSGRLQEDPDVEAIFFIRQVLYMAKKVSVRCSDARTIEAIQGFYDTDCSLPQPHGYWQMPHVDRSQTEMLFQGFQSAGHQINWRSVKTEGGYGGLEPLVRAMGLLRTLDKVSGILVSTLGPYDPSEWSCKHGPGAISQVTGPSNKYSWHSWSSRLESVFPIADYGFHSHSSWATLLTEGGEIPETEPVARLVDVPKTLTKPRLIAVEPSEHQWCQQNLWHYFRTRMSETWIDCFCRFGDQGLNRELALEGSRDGRLATLDLSEASDRMTCMAVGNLLRVNPRLLEAVRATRTIYVKQDRHVGVPQIIHLRKFSTMGNACTFPLESLMFLAVALAATLYERYEQVTPRSIIKLAGEVAVFGDDLIVPVESRSSVEELLELIWFKVNASKSFSVGQFRESCGVDAFRGVNVTPAYWKAPCTGTPESVATTVEIRNNFHQKWLLNTANYVASTLPDGVRLVAMDSGVFGLKTFCRPRVPLIVAKGRVAQARQRWNVNLHRVESSGLAVYSQVTKVSTNDDSALLQYFTEQPMPTTKWRHGYVQRPRMKMRAKWAPNQELRLQ